MYVLIAHAYFEPGGERNCGRVGVNLWREHVARNWHEHCRENLLQLGPATGRSIRRMLRHPERNIRAFVHGDDYASGDISELFGRPPH